MQEKKIFVGVCVCKKRHGIVNMRHGVPKMRHDIPKKRHDIPKIQDNIPKMRHGCSNLNFVIFQTHKQH